MTLWYWVFAANSPAHFDWLRNGREVFPEMLAAIRRARHSIALETYIFSATGLGVQFRDALAEAAGKGLRVQVLYDALGSLGLSGGFWLPLLQAGGQVRQFNPLSLHRLGIRDHRKLLVCDEQIAFVGGFNIAPEYDGDGVTSGWYDIGLKIRGPLARELAVAFEEMFANADFRPKSFIGWASACLPPPEANEQLLLSGPGRWRNPLKRALRQDLADAREVRIMVAYFLPTWRLRRDLMRIARQGRRVQLLLAGKSDVLVSQLAGQSLYRRFLKAGVQVFEYQPQILHAKLLIIDDVVYVGSANLDQRSLNINHELMVRLQNPDLAARARETFSANLKHCRRITLEDWSRSRTLWRRFKQFWAYFLLVRIDPYIARWQWRAWREQASGPQMALLRAQAPGKKVGSPEL